MLWPHLKDGNDEYTCLPYIKNNGLAYMYVHTLYIHLLMPRYYDVKRNPCFQFSW